MLATRGKAIRATHLPAAHAHFRRPLFLGLQVASLRQQLQEQRNAADTACQRAEEAAQQKVAALVRVSEAEGGRSRADGRIAQLTEASEGAGRAVGCHGR